MDKFGHAYRVDNEIEGSKEVGSPVLSSAPEGVGLVTTGFNYQLFTSANVKATFLETKADYSIEVVYDVASASGQSMKFDFPQNLLTGNVVPGRNDSGKISDDTILENGQHSTENTELIVTVETAERRIEQGSQ